MTPQDTRTQQDFQIIKDVYYRFYDAMAVSGLINHFIQGHGHALKLGGDLKQIGDFLARADKAKRIEEPNILAGIVGRFDAHAAFNSKTERGGKDQQLTKILNALEPAYDGLPDLRIVPKHEPEITRVNERVARKTEEVNKHFDTAQRYFYNNLANYLFSGSAGQDYAGQHATRWIAQHIQGGKEIADKITTSFDAASLIGYYANEGSAAEGIRLLQMRDREQAKHVAAKSVPTI